MPTEDQTQQRGRCPVKHGGDEGSSHNPAVAWSFWARLLLPSSAGSAPATTSTPNTSASSSAENEALSSCPVAAAGDTSNLPASLEEAARHAQTPQPDQTVPLGRDRQVSSIPRSSSSTSSNATTTLPHHQHDVGDNNSDNNNKWVYPSEQQLYNAMRRKGWSNVPEESIPAVLQIHNHINERTWGQIRAWEGCGDRDDRNSNSNSNSDNGGDELVLTRFQGRPNDLSPKAYFLSQVLGRCERPFDRHDWYVAHKQNNGNENSSSNDTGTTTATTASEQRYVIDYYYRKPAQPHLPPVPHVDARPALDHPRAFYLRGRRFLREAFPGIAAHLSSPASAASNNNSNSNSNEKPSSS